MKILKPTAMSWSARIGVVAVVAAAGVVAMPTASYAAPLAVVAAPSTGTAGTWVTIETATPNTFRDASGNLRIGNTGEVINLNAIQFSANTSSTAVCPASGVASVSTPMPAGSRTIPDVSTAASSLALTSASGGFLSTDASKTITGTGIPASTTVNTVTSANSAALLTNVATATGTVGVAIGAATGPYWAQQAVAVSDTKLLVQAPAYLPSSVNPYSICVWDTNASTTGGTSTTAIALTISTFRAYPPPVISSVNKLSGPSIGKNTVIISGTGFSNPTSGAPTTVAMIGGAPLMGLTPGTTPTIVTTTTPQTITGLVPPSAQDPADVTVTAEGGTATYGTQYHYQDGLSLTPTMMTPSSTAVLDIFGAGFKKSTNHFANLVQGNLNLGAVTFTDVGDLVTTTDGPHGLAVGDRVRFGAITTTTGLTAGLAYFIKTVPSATTFTLAAAPGDTTAVVIGGGDGSAVAVYRIPVGYIGTATTASSGNVITSSVNHGLVVGDRVKFTTPGSSNLIAGTVYYVLTASTLTFTVSATQGGAAFTLATEATPMNLSRSPVGSNNLGDVAIVGTTFDTVTTNAGADNLAPGDRVQFQGLSPSTGLTDGTTYYVVNPVVDPTTFKVATNATLAAAGTAIDLTAGTATDVLNVTDKNTHVFLALGSYSRTATYPAVGGMAAECANVLVLTDNELVCTVTGTSVSNPARIAVAGSVLSHLPHGSYQLALVHDLTGTLLDPLNVPLARTTIVTSKSAFTVAPY